VRARSYVIISRTKSRGPKAQIESATSASPLLRNNLEDQIQRTRSSPRPVRDRSNGCRQRPSDANLPAWAWPTPQARRCYICKKVHGTLRGRCQVGGLFHRLRRMLRRRVPRRRHRRSGPRRRRRHARPTAAPTSRSCARTTYGGSGGRWPRSGDAEGIFSPFFFWGTTPLRGDVFRSMLPLPAGTYWLFTTIDGVEEWIRFTKTC
jgi:hypothetical protein